MIRLILLSIFTVSEVLCCLPIGFKQEFMYGCSIFINKLDHGPLLLSADTHQLLYPDFYKARVHILPKEKFILSCPGSRISASGVNFSTTEKATCLPNGQLKISSETVDFNKIGCSSDPSHSIRPTGNSCAGGAGKEIEIGFSITSDIFVRQILICFDKQRLTPFYVAYNVSRSINLREGAVVDKSNFIEDSFDKLKVNELYETETLRQVINSRVGLPSDSTKYIKDVEGLVRGYLAPKDSFVYPWQQLATLHYANSVPLWHNFVNSDWKKFNAVFRRYIELGEFDPVLYVGTYGVATLPHEETGDDVPLYLFEDQNVTKIPVPELFWKVLYSPKIDDAAIIGVNAPFQTTEKKLKYICNVTSDNFEWPKWVVPEIQPNLKSGYIYMCDVDDLRKQIPYLPVF